MMSSWNPAQTGNPWIGFTPFPTESINELVKKMTGATHVGVLVHSKADGDAVGGAEALRLALTALNVSSEIIAPDQPKTVFGPCPTPLNIGRYNTLPDLLISNDCADPARFYCPPEFQSLFLVNIDHHISNPLFGSLQFVRPACSACEVLTTVLVQAFGENFITPLMAEALLFGILNDSQMFVYTDVNQSTFAITQFLINRGAEYHKIKAMINQKMPTKLFQIWATLIAASRLVCNDQVLILKIDREFIETNQLTFPLFGEFANFVGNQVDADVIVLLSEFDSDKVTGSLRSKVTDVNQVAGVFGGGGHKHAAGFRVKGGKLNEAEVQVVEELKKVVC